MLTHNYSFYYSKLPPTYEFRLTFCSRQMCDVGDEREELASGEEKAFIQARVGTDRFKLLDVSTLIDHIPLKAGG